MNYFEIMNKVRNAFYKGLTKVIYQFCFNKIGKNTKIIKPLSLRNTRYITLGSGITINAQVFMMTQKMDASSKPMLTIEDGTTIGHYNHIVCCDEVYIGKNVLTADKVYISDNCHNYNDVTLPISRQGIYSKGKVEIGDETWIGENACIICARIGKHCVVGANSVVTRDIPDYCVVCGAPARIIKRYDIERGQWIRYDEQ